MLDRGRGGVSGLQNLMPGSGGGIYLEVAASVTTFLLAGQLYEAHAPGAPPGAALRTGVNEPQTPNSADVDTAA